MEDEVVTEVESPQFDLNMTLASPTPSSAPYQGLYLQETSFDGSVASTQSSRRSYASVTISSLQGQGPEDWSIGNVLESKSPERQRRIARLKRPPTRSTESVQIPPQKDPRKEEIWLVNHAVDVERRLRLELLEVLDELEEEKQRTKEKQKKAGGTFAVARQADEHDRRPPRHPNGRGADDFTRRRKPSR